MDEEFLGFDNEMTSRKRRSSILKRDKSQYGTCDNDIDTDEALRVTRRVSFARRNSIKPFQTDPEENTIWDNTYQEDADCTDTTKSIEQTHNNIGDFKPSSVALVNSAFGSITQEELIINKENLYFHEPSTGTKFVNVSTNKSLTMDITNLGTNLLANSSELPSECLPSDANPKKAGILKQTTCQFIYTENIEETETITNKRRFLDLKDTMDLTSIVNAQQTHIRHEEGNNKRLKTAYDKENMKNDQKEQMPECLTSDSDMDIASVLSPCELKMNKSFNFVQAETKEQSTTQSKRKTIVFEPDEGDLEFTATLPVVSTFTSVAHNEGVSLFTMAKQRLSNVSIEKTENTERVNRTTVFETENEMELTSVLPVIGSRNGKKLMTDNFNRTKVFNSSEDDMSFTSVLPVLDKAQINSTLWNKKINNSKRRTIVFQPSEGDMEFTAVLPDMTDVAPSTGNPDKTLTAEFSGEIISENIKFTEHTKVYEHSEANMEFTSVMPDINPKMNFESIRHSNFDQPRPDVKNLTSRNHTKVFEQSEGFMELTEVSLVPDKTLDGICTERTLTLVPCTSSNVEVEVDKENITTINSIVNIEDINHGTDFENIQQSDDMEISNISETGVPLIKENVVTKRKSVGFQPSPAEMDSKMVPPKVEESHKDIINPNTSQLEITEATGSAPSGGDTNIKEDVPKDVVKNIRVMEKSDPNKIIAIEKIDPSLDVSRENYIPMISDSKQSLSNQGDIFENKVADFKISKPMVNESSNTEDGVIVLKDRHEEKPMEANINEEKVYSCGQNFNLGVNIVYSEPVKVLTTPPPSFYSHCLSLDNEDTRQLINATFSNEESFKLELTNRIMKDLKQTDTEDSVIMCHLNEISGRSTRNNSNVSGECKEEISLLMNTSAELVNDDSEMEIIEENAEFQTQTVENVAQRNTELVNHKSKLEPIHQTEEIRNQPGRHIRQINTSTEPVNDESKIEQINPIEIETNTVTELGTDPSKIDPTDQNQSDANSPRRSDYHNYTLRSKSVLANIKKFMYVPSQEDVEKKQQMQETMDNLFQECLDNANKIRNLRKNLKLMMLEDVSQENDTIESSSCSINDGKTSTEEEDTNRESVGQLEIPKTLYENVREAVERLKKHLQLVKYENDVFYFYCLYGTVPFKVHVNPEIGIVCSIEAFSNVGASAKPIIFYNTEILLQKLKRENLLSSLGTRYDIFTLLDYVSMTVQEIFDFHSVFNQLCNQRGSYRISMDKNFRITIKVLNVHLMLWWVISVKLSVTNIGSPEDVSAYEEIGEKVNEADIKNIARNSTHGVHFLNNFIKNIAEYVDRIRKKLKYAR